MRKGGKILLWVVGILVVLAVAATVALKLYLTKERILAWVVPPLEEKLHRKVTIADAGAGFTGIHLDGLDVRAEGAPEPLVAAERILIRWDLWALLQRRVDLKEIRLVAPRIRVVRNPDGSLDVQDLLAGGGEKPTAEPAAPKTEPAEAGELPVAVAIALFSLERGRIAFEDRAAEPTRTYVLDEVESRIRGFALDRPVPFELSAKLPLAAEGRFSVAGTLNPQTRRLEAKLGIASFDLPALRPLLGEGGLVPAAGVFSLDLDVKGTAGGPMDLAGVAGVKGLVLARGADRGEPADVRLDLAAGLDPAQSVVELSRFRAEVAGQTVDLTATARYGATPPRVDFRLTSPELLADPFLALLPPAEEGAAAPPAGAEPQAPAAAGEPAAPPLDAVGDLEIGRLGAGGLALEGFRAHVELLGGRLSVKPLEARVYGGELQAAAGADLASEGPAFEADLTLVGTQLAQLLPALSPALENTMTGVVELEAKASGRDGDLEALTADLRAEAKDGKILNHPLVKQFAELFQVKELETLNFYSLKLDAGAAGGVGTVRSFVLNGPDVQATGTGTVGLVDKALDLKLAVALPRRIAARLVRQGEVLDALTDEQGWSRVPLRLTGTAEAPAYGLDTEALARMGGKVLEKKAQKVLEEKVLKKLPVGEGEKKAIDQGLQKLFGR
ncbi:DUF748 domain-containing protein [Deferrisoma palaeochoriense]